MKIPAYSRLLPSLFLLSLLIPVTATAAGPKEVTPASSEARPFTKIFSNFSVQLGLDAAGPVYFKDTADGRLEELSVFQYGGHLNLMFGNTFSDRHRLGLGFFFAPTAVSENRNLSYMAPYLVYETGRDWILQLEAGYNLTSASKDLEKQYDGAYLGSGISYVFLKPSPDSPIYLSLGLKGRAMVNLDQPEYSSMFVGLQLELTYQTVKP